MRFLADMGISLRVVEWLREGNHDAKHLREENLQRLPNGEIFEKAIREHRIILTCDLDFAELVALTGGRKTGVILFRLYNTRASHDIARLEAVLRDMALPLTDSVVIIEETRYRIRKFPK